jgi:hypothetical protein
VGKPLERHPNRHVRIGFQSSQRLRGDGGAMRLLIRERKRGYGDDDGVCTAGLTGQFCRGSAARAATQTGQKHHQFSPLEDWARHGVEPTHALFCKSRQRGTTLRLHGMAKTKHVAFRPNAEATVVGIDRQKTRAWAPAMGRSGPRATKASYPCDDDLSTVHEKTGGCNGPST